MSEIGEAESDDNRLKAISWGTVKAWSDVTGMRLTPGEALAIRSLSRSYVNQYYLSESPGCLSPNVEELPASDVVVDKLKSMFAMLRK